jgi:hypothetical protein
VVPSFVQTETAVALGNIKIIEIKTGLCKRKLSLENFVGTFFDLVGQGEREGFGAIFPGDDAGDCGCLNGRRDVDVQGAGLVRHQCAKGVFINQLFGIEKNTHILLLGVFILWDEPGILYTKSPGKGRGENNKRLLNKKKPGTENRPG